MAFIPNTVEEYKIRLGYGQRQNMFNVELTFPGGVGIDVDLETEFNILCTNAQWPKDRNIEPIPVQKQGEWFKLPGDRVDVEPVTFGFKNTTNINLRQAFVQWMDFIHQNRSGIRNLPSSFTTSIFISMLDAGRNETRKVELVNAWPTAIAEAIELNDETKEISITNITVDYDYHRYIDV